MYFILKFTLPSRLILCVINEGSSRTLVSIGVKMYIYTLYVAYKVWWYLKVITIIIENQFL